jgi:hypothetical protein
MSAREHGAAMEAMTGSATKEDLEETKREIADVKATIAKLYMKIETMVDKAEDKIKEEEIKAAKDDENPAAVVENPRGEDAGDSEERRNHRYIIQSWRRNWALISGTARVSGIMPSRVTSESLG